MLIELSLHSANMQNSSLFFNDGQRSIDFILVWKADDERTQETLNRTKRSIFEANLIRDGLELERESIEELHFIKIHAPMQILRNYSEILKLRMPMKVVCQNTLIYSLNALNL